MMTRITTIGLLLGTTLGLTAILAPAAQASEYASSSGKTTIWLQERRTPNSGSYNTEFQGQTWYGKINIDRAEGAAGTYYYTGTFEDSPGGNSSNKCTGNIQLARRGSADRSAKLTLEATWKVTGGTRCPSIGKTFTVNLTETLPQPNAQGDYTKSWSRWRVVSPDGELNCRVKPNGKIVRVIKSSDEIFLDGRLGDTISAVDGASWMYVPYSSTSYTNDTYKPCYVRANEKYIRPISLPF